MKMFSPPVSSLSSGGMPTETKLVRPLVLLSRLPPDAELTAVVVGVGAVPTEPWAAVPDSVRPPAPALEVIEPRAEFGNGGKGASRLPQREIEPLRETLAGKVSLSGRAACASSCDAPLPHAGTVSCQPGTAGVSGVEAFQSRPEKNERIVVADFMLTPRRRGEELGLASEDRDGDRWSWSGFRSCSRHP